MTRSIPVAARVAMLSGVVAAFHLGKVPPAITVLQSELGLSVVSAGFLLSLMQVAGMTAGIVMGTLCDRVGTRRSLVTGQCLLGLASLIGAGADSATELLVLRALESLGLLLVVLPTPALIRRVVPEAQLSFCMGLWGCYVAVGTAVAFLIGPIMTQSLGWRFWWLLPAVASALMVALVLRAVPPEARGQKRQARSAEVQGRHWLQSVRNTKAWFIGVAFAVYAGQWLAVIGFLPRVYSALGLSPLALGAFSAGATLANAAGSFSAAILLRRGVRAYRLLLVGYVGIVPTVLLAFSPYAHATFALQYLAILVFSAIGGLIPGSLFFILVKPAPGERVGASTVGMVQQLTSFGMFVTPPLLAKLSVLVGGWQWAWLFIGINSAIALLLLSSGRVNGTDDSTCHGR